MTLTNSLVPAAVTAILGSTSTLPATGLTPGTSRTPSAHPTQHSSRAHKQLPPVPELPHADKPRMRRRASSVASKLLDTIMGRTTTTTPEPWAMGLRMAGGPASAAGGGPRKSGVTSKSGFTSGNETEGEDDTRTALSEGVVGQAWRITRNAEID